MIKLRNRAWTWSRIVLVYLRAHIRPPLRLCSVTLLRRLRWRRCVVRAAYFDNLCAEGLEHLLDDGVSFGALAQKPLLAPRLVVGRELFVLFRLARSPQLDVDADGASQHLAADLAQKLLVLGLHQGVAQVLALGRELDAHLVVFDPHATRAVERYDEQELAAPFEPALEARHVVVRPKAHLNFAGVLRGSLRGDERDGSADHVFARARAFGEPARRCEESVGGCAVRERERRFGRTRRGTFSERGRAAR